MAKTFQLTGSADRFKGTKGGDMFIADPDSLGAPTLGATDRLDGGGGRDTITGLIGPGTLSPVLKSIETAVFSFVTDSAIRLGLGGARSLSALTLSDDGTVTVPGAAISVSKASALKSFTLNGDTGNTISVSGIGAAGAKAFSLTAREGIGTTIQLDTASGKDISKLSLSLDSRASVRLSGDVGVNTLVIGSDGADRLGNGGSNTLIMDAADARNVRTVTVKGNGGLDISDAVFSNLSTYDASAANARVQASIGGSNLKSVTGSGSNDALIVTKAHANVSVRLGAGDDAIELKGAGAFDGATMRFDGGADSDQLILHGRVKGFGTDSVSNFDRFDFQEAIGTLSLAGMSVSNLRFGTALSGDMTVNDLADQSQVTIGASSSHDLMVNGTMAAKDTDAMRLVLTGGVDFGSAAKAQFLAPGLSKLAIQSDGAAGQTNSLGMAVKVATGGSNELQLTIEGTVRLDLAMPGTGAMVSTVTITNAAGFDMTGIQSRLLDRGTTQDSLAITGGGGADMLYGGSGHDQIASGGGGDTIIGGGGLDRITLSTDGKADVIRYGAQADAAANATATIKGLTIQEAIFNFDALDVIELSTLTGGVRPTWGGTFSGPLANAAPLLSTSAPVAVYDSLAHQLYVDLDHSGGIDATKDLAILITSDLGTIGVESFLGSANFL